MDDLSLKNQWDARKLNLLSVSLLVLCECIDSVGKLWTNFLCINFGKLENLSTIAFGFAVVMLQTPLFMDLVYILLQKVHPMELSPIIQREINQVEQKYDILIKWHLWSQDMSHQVCTLKSQIQQS